MADEPPWTPRPTWRVRSLGRPGSFLDVFNRPDGPLGAGWGLVDPAYPLPTISGKQAVAAGQCSGYWTTRLAANQQVHARVASFADTLNLMLRLYNVPSGVESGYEARFAAGTVIVNKVQAAFRTQLLNVARAIPNAPYCGFRANGTTFTAWDSQDGVNWLRAGSCADASFQNDGYAGFFSNSGETLSQFGASQLASDPGGGSLQNGADTGITLGLGNATIASAYTLLVVAKLQNAQDGCLLDMATVDDLNLYFQTGNSGLSTYDGTNESQSTVTPVAGHWCVYAVTRAAGASVIPTFYRNDLDAHTNTSAAGAAATNQTAAANGWTIGYSTQFAKPVLGAITAAAIWKTALTGAQIQGITSLAALKALNPDWLVPLTGTPPFADTAGGAAQTAIGTTAHSIDQPAGW